MAVIPASTIVSSPVVTSFKATSPSVSSDSASSTKQTDIAQSKTTESEGAKAEALSAAEKQLVSQLQESDKRVKAHEMAHLMAAGGYAKGGASYQFRQGPDGKKYAVAGEVQISAGQESSPEQTIAKMKIVRRAALAPADPSSQDRKVAAQASNNITVASMEIRAEAVALQEQSVGDDSSVEDSQVTPSTQESAHPSDTTGHSAPSLVDQKGVAAYTAGASSSPNPSRLSLFA